MARFKIIRKDPTLYRQEIIKLWEEYLPGTPQGRFDWMNHGNPAGQTAWFFAFEEKTGDLAGCISIMPRDYYLNGKVISAGILGDFVVTNKYRVFGPGLQLPKAAIKSSSELGFRFIYTIPNTESKKIMERAGFTDIGFVYYLIKPISARYFLEKKIHPLLAKISAPLIDLGLRILSRETYAWSGGGFQEVSTIDQSFDHLWERISISHPGILGDHSSAYLNWRYLKNPLYQFHILTYIGKLKRDLLGYVIYTIGNGALEIHDIIAIDKKCLVRLLKKIVGFARQQKYHSIYLGIFENNLWLKKLKTYWFFDSKYEMKLFFSDDIAQFPKNWTFFSGDRNI